MAITKLNPRTVRLFPAGDRWHLWDDRDYVASAAIKPGHLVEFHDDGSNLDVRPHSAEDRMVTMAVADTREEMNKGLTDNYAAGDMVKIAWVEVGYVFYGLVPSGQNIARGDFLESVGDGTLKEAADVDATDNNAKFQSLDNLGSISTETRCRVLRVQ